MMRLAYDILGHFTAYILYPYAERKTGRSILPRLGILRREAAMSFPERKRLACSLLHRMLEYAGKTVPYYRDLFFSRHFDPAKVLTDPRYLGELPYLTKDILREQGVRMFSTKAEKPLYERKTGSSTGPATLIMYDQESLDWTAAQNIQMLEWAGKHRFNREAHLSTRFIQPLPDFAVREERRKCFVLNRCNIYTGGFDDASQKKLWEDLRNAHARFVQGHPSSLFTFARYVEKMGGLKAPLFDVFVSTGEMLEQRQREAIEKALHCRVMNRYGACEFGVMAQECARGPYGSLLVADSIVWPEVADTQSDGIGELVFSSLRNTAMPLIRYRMGDLGTLVEAEDGWRITSLFGRVHDSVNIDGEKYPTHYIQDILERCGPITDFQIAVSASGEAVEFRLVVDDGAWDRVSSAVLANFPSVSLRRIYSEELVFVGSRGKFRYLVQMDRQA